jgi:hypothetical protein
MIKNGRSIGLCFLLFSFFSLSAQTEIKVPEERELMYRPFLAIHHGGMEGLEEFKHSNPLLYYKELWYYASSFFVKRNCYPEGYSISERYIDISRYEQNRLSDKESFIRMSGSCDAIVLLPSNQLLYKPSFITK